MKLVRENFGGKAVFVGIDVHLKTYSVVCTGEDIATYKVGSMPADPNTLIRNLKKRFPGANLMSAYEAGFSGLGLHRALATHGIDNIVVNPASIEVAANDKSKTDKRDATKLSLQLKRGQLVGIRVPSIDEELRRQITRTRAQIVEQRTRTGNQIRAKMRYFSVPLPVDLDAEGNEKVVVMSQKLVKKILSLPLPTELKFAIGSLASIYTTLNDEIDNLDHEIARQAKSDAVFEATYQSLPGFGPVTSRTFANELGDMSQFANERALFNFLGLTPSEHSSGERQRFGRITKKGAGRLRGLLVEAAWRAIKRDPLLEKIFEHLKQRRGARRAIVAIARRLIGRGRACFRSGKPYELGRGLQVS